MVGYFLLSYRLLGSNSNHKAEFKEPLTTEPSCWLRLCFVVLGDCVFILEYFRYLTMSTILNACSIAQSSLLMLSFAFLIWQDIYFICKYLLPTPLFVSFSPKSHLLYWNVHLLCCLLPMLQTFSPRLWIDFFISFTISSLYKWIFELVIKHFICCGCFRFSNWRVMVI